ncbi:DUF2063 domain-containing protein [Shewanella psychropiezotolerans]|uniref:DUF2063 domain-containing protein n=1 Tax=Shewanella psychropiezotolerans TaxID=2593655 RepID=A0ABX5WW82_9GAMM|nr:MULTISPECIES: putative DNA-binding domain-containing protein [Shewanella]MPY22987.1 DUF2063 domain-containing protein [Shewanella sp. YLB-07]QDO82652.1 DUF2063 domain-containing protein [Shewanella psychropiezotolerans]
MHNPPEKLCRDTQRLTQAIRHQSMTTNKANVILYREFIIDNISDVISNTFPLFSFSLGVNDKEKLVLEFLYHHPSTEPEFHNIATEFVRFIQGYNAISPILLSLIEFEWVIYSTEINPLTIKHSEVMPELNDFNVQEVYIYLNQTLQCIEVPFSIDQAMVGFCHLRPDRLSYGIFRNIKHQVLWQELTLIDRFIIGYLNQVMPVSYSEIKEYIDKNLKHFDLNMWLTQSHKTNLINMSYKEEFHD